VPCVTHCANRYDQQLLIKALVERNKSKGARTPHILPRNTEQYLAVFSDAFIFLDSGKFMKSSLSLIADSMMKTGSTAGGTHGNTIVFPLLDKHVARHNKEKYKLLCRKGVFCYDLLDGPEKLCLKSMPAKADFLDSLRDSHISSSDYEHAQRVWRTFGCRTLRDYLLIYLHTDILLLADCFERFRDLSHRFFEMDTAKFLTLPQFAFHAMLKYTGITLDTMDNLEMVQWVRRGVRGGVALIMLSHAKANVPEMGEEYDQSQPRREIVALDCTNLNGHALCKQLPERNYYWLGRREIDALPLENLPDDSKIGYILSVDLTYPEELHKTHTMYPLAPHKVAIPPAQWSDHTHTMVRELEAAYYFKTCPEKLVPDLTEKRDYVIHYQNLRYYLQSGMILKRVRRVLAFEHSRWMADFVNFITEQRKNAVSDFESSFW
jgi:hypothetical protein